jgi:hypothetical protein
MLHNLLSARRDSAPQHTDEIDSEIYAALGITGPGAYVIREPDDRLMVWACEADSLDDDGKRAVYRSRIPITDDDWATISALAWVESAESI